ncbi:MAG: hypothetical protein RL346_1679 [Verrucomicrobiota bacterium]|jgi:outer membrane protein assembly factor BamD (BamD/ComL family)
MTKTFFKLAQLTVAAMLVVSCGNDDEYLGLAGAVQNNSGEGEALYQKAKSYDDAGKSGKAMKLYAEVADDHPTSRSAPQARFRQAEILEQKGDIPNAFKTYQKFLARYPSSGLYTKALDRQAKMAQAAADGEVKSSFLGLKAKISTERVVEMMQQLRDNAPRSEVSAKAQFTIGEIYHGKKMYKDSIEAYRKLVHDQPDNRLAPEALFRVALVFLEQADRGNHNQATLDLAGESLNDYLLQYPSHSRNGEARKLLDELKGKDLNRSLEIAKFYDRTGATESAKVYYRDIVSKSRSGSAHDHAKKRLSELGE